MKLIVAGSRTVGWKIENDVEVPNEYHRSVIFDELDKLKDAITEVVCGCAKGPDTIGESWAVSRGVPIKYFPPYWEVYGKRAGILRNEEMGKYADQLLAFWDGKSKGTAHMMSYMVSLGKPVKVIRFT